MILSIFSGNAARFSGCLDICRMLAICRIWRLIKRCMKVNTLEREKKEEQNKNRNEGESSLFIDTGRIDERKLR